MERYLFLGKVKSESDPLLPSSCDPLVSPSLHRQLLEEIPAKVCIVLIAISLRYIDSESIFEPCPNWRCANRLACGQRISPKPSPICQPMPQHAFHLLWMRASPLQLNSLKSGENTLHTLLKRYIHISILSSLATLSHFWDIR